MRRTRRYPSQRTGQRPRFSPSNDNLRTINRGVGKNGITQTAETLDRSSLFEGMNPYIQAYLSGKGFESIQIANILPALKKVFAYALASVKTAMWEVETFQQRDLLLANRVIAIHKENRGFLRLHNTDDNPKTPGHHRISSETEKIRIGLGDTIGELGSFLLNRRPSKLVEVRGDGHKKTARFLTGKATLDEIVKWIHENPKFIDDFEVFQKADRSLKELSNSGVSTIDLIQLMIHCLGRSAAQIGDYLNKAEKAGEIPEARLSMSNRANINRARAEVIQPVHVPEGHIYRIPLSQLLQKGRFIYTGGDHNVSLMFGDDKTGIPLRSGSIVGYKSALGEAVNTDNISIGFGHTPDRMNRKRGSIQLIEGHKIDPSELIKISAAAQVAGLQGKSDTKNRGKKTNVNVPALNLAQ